MGVQKRIPWLLSLAVVLAAMTLWGTRAGADTTSDRPGSIAVWPKVIADGTRDTIVTLTNTSNLQVYAHCEYVVGTGTCSLTPEYCSRPAAFAGGGSPDCTQTQGAPANQCLISWQTADFDVILTRQQPTFWRVSTGRVENLLLPITDPVACMTFLEGTTLRQSCPGLFLIGNVPPAVGAPLLGTDEDDPTFRGELKCIQVNEDGSPNGANALKGEAIIEVLGTNQISKYNSINIIAQDGTDTSPLELNGIAYNACPEAVEATHYAPGASDLVAADLGAPCAGSGCPVRTEITLVPCREDFILEEGSRFASHFEVWDEFEQFFSVDQPFDCWANVDIADLGFTNVNSSTFQHTRVTSTGTGLCIAGTNLGGVCTSDAACGGGGVCGPVSGVLMVVEQFHENDNSFPPPGPLLFPGPDLIEVGTDAENAYAFDSNGDGSLQRLGRCRQALTTRCDEDGDCPTGRCRIATTTPCVNNDQCDGDASPNQACVAILNPVACCTGAGTGTCVSGPADDFCDQCMNDEIFYEAGPIVPQQ